MYNYAKMLHTHRRQSIKGNYQRVLDLNFSTINPNNLVLMVHIKMLASLSAHELIICETIFRNIVYFLRYTHAFKHFYGQTNILVKASLDKELRSTNGKDS